MTDWLLPFLCGLGAAVISAWGVGGGTLLLLVMTLFLGVDQRMAQGINLLFFLPTAISHMEGRRPRGCPGGTCRGMDRHSGGCGPAAPPLRYLPAALWSFADFPPKGS